MYLTHFDIYLIDPMINPSEPEHYLSFDGAMLKETTENDCPVLKNYWIITFAFFIQHMKNANVIIQCEECLMWTLLFSKRKLTISHKEHFRLY